MTSERSVLSIFDVRVDRTRLRREGLGPLIARVSVGLTPSLLDADWLSAYETISRESDRFARFTLDPSNGIILFNCRANETAAQIEALLQRLELLLELANLRATIVGASRQSETA